MSGMITRARAFSTKALQVFDNVAKQQFVVTLSGHEAAIDYAKSGNQITLKHTNVPPVFQGKGVGKLLAKYAFDHAAQSKLNVICQCHFLAKFYENNLNQYKDLKVKLDLQD